VGERYRTVCARVDRQIRRPRSWQPLPRSTIPRMALSCSRGSPCSAYLVIGCASTKQGYRCRCAGSGRVHSVGGAPWISCSWSRGRTAEYAVLEHEENSLIDLHASFPVVYVRQRTKCVRPSRNRGPGIHANGFRVRGWVTRTCCLCKVRRSNRNRSCDDLVPEAALLIQDVTSTRATSLCAPVSVRDCAPRRTPAMVDSAICRIPAGGAR